MAACPDECDLIVGIEDAAGFLGYGKADSFRRARTRHPIPGETGTSGGRPCLDSPRPAQLAQPGEMAQTRPGESHTGRRRGTLGMHMG